MRKASGTLCLATLTLLYTGVAFAQENPVPAQDTGVAAKVGAPEQTVTPETSAQTTPVTNAPHGDNSWMEYHDPYVVDQSDLSQPNLTSEEIIIWAQKIAADALTLSKADYLKRLSSVKEKFSQEGWGDYATYLKGSKLVELVKDGRYSISAVSNNEGSIINRQAVDGAFQWLVKVPVIISVIQVDATGQPVTTISSGKFNLMVQVGRIKPKPNGEGVSVSAWTVRNDPQAR